MLWFLYHIKSWHAWVMTACWVSCSRLTNFQRNMNISTIFYFSKSTSINTQYSSLWDILMMMLFTKYPIKWKRIGIIRWKFQYWFNVKSSIELDLKGHWTTSASSPNFFQKSWDLYTIKSVYLCSDCMLNLTCNFHLIMKICEFFLLSFLKVYF